ncbi:PREDICTED: huntingtin-interacting protein 1-like [Pygoscelis adeliae]|uniref:huntingtin-interacting protein 1-like n=1 Tax=Pygoscelis adeliae TaxID=9238 RepID=UPI0004F4F174|nr:PREDICTED: huntingtin-interacting protein 1-like [Pygoscelis adeliae]
MSRMWGHLSEGYGQLCSIYLKLLRTKMEFHTKNPRFPGNLQMSDRQLDEAGENDVNNFFQLTVEMFDYLEGELNLFQTVFSSLDMSRSVSVTAAGQCRLAPLIQVILDCSHLYDYTVKLLFKLHSCLPADTLQGHRDRFLEQFRKLKDLFYRSSNLQYFKRLIQIPQLPENPPNFLRASALSEHISPVVVIPAEASSPDSEPITDLVEMDTASQSLFDNKFDDIFGSSFSSDPFNFNSQNGMNKDDKDRLIEQLYGEIAALKEELENFKAEVGDNHPNAEVTKQVTAARQAQGDVEREKKELEDSFQRVSEQAQRKSQEQAEVLDTLKRELAASRQELQVLQGTLESSTQAGAEQSTRIAGLEQERDSLSQAAEQHGEEMAALRAELQQLRDTLSRRGFGGPRPCHLPVPNAQPCLSRWQGVASPKEFYAKNSRWTEGLISASKAVGWGATVMVDAADLVVQGKGTFEELMVCSREIAASTAQLVAASKVKADKDSANLCKLQQASRGVNQATAGVVASTKAGKSQVEEKDSMDFSSMTLTQIKRQEMDSQVRVLELENQLQKERQKLGELRKKHYELAGVAEGWEEDAAD